MLSHTYYYRRSLLILSKEPPMLRCITHQTWPAHRSHLCESDLISVRSNAIGDFLLQFFRFDGYHAKRNVAYFSVADTFDYVTLLPSPNYDENATI